MNTSASPLGEGACQSMQLSAIEQTSEPDRQRCGVSGRKGSLFTWGSGGGSNQQLTSQAVRETESEGPLHPFSGNRSDAGRNFMVSLELPGKCSPHNLCQHPTLPRDCFSRQKMLSAIFKPHVLRPSIAGAVFSRWCLSVRKIDFLKTPSQGPCPPQPQSVVHRSTGVTWDVLTTCESR